ncbi:hypothetical protein EJ05DRAFT_480221 [Pseudovirgaria hyperparasitica]|uniref:Elongin-A n=1 Tax=Pseudovirgaria hyperparasitica TaxID=470096 RepID=A0A6A6VVD0_9PEZI|nr:uncharacterized protein EJ05DRAFT_480221 [Pseudovirgaria hyperparasitica]KAF2753746.1 hypothetical protein EJ05DRAFT_480221 [Pseudovirgaria hyperparasitica]
MPVASLTKLALRAVVRNITAVDDVGSLEYEWCQPFLRKIDNPEQLYRLEQNCPQIAGKDDELWLAIIRKEIPNYHKYPEDLKARGRKNWYKFYKYLQKQEAEAAQRSSQNLAERLKRIEDERSMDKTQFVPERITQGPKRRRTTPLRRSTPSIISTTRKPFTKAANSVPHKVPISSDLIAQRKAAKEAQEMKKVPKILQSEPSRPAPKRKLSFDDEDEDIFGDSMASIDEPTATPPRKIAVSKTKPVPIKRKTVSYIPPPRRSPTGLTPTPSPPPPQKSSNFTANLSKTDVSGHRQTSPTNLPARPLRRKKKDVSVFMPPNQSRFKR